MRSLKSLQVTAGFLGWVYCLAQANDEKYNVIGFQQDTAMSDNEQATTDNSSADGFVDAIAAMALVIIPVLAIIFWLSGQ